jgi:hypothetical protein
MTTGQEDDDGEGHQATGMKNREYVRKLLREKQPEFSATLELAMNLARREPRSQEIQRDVSASGVS